MVKVMGIAVVVVLAGVLIFAATKPRTFRVQREIFIKAPAAKIFPLINDFHQWQAWSPYENLDPAMKRTFSGEPLGKGAVYAWAGNHLVGQGRMEITNSNLPSKIVVQLDFDKPMKASNISEFTLESQGAGTKVTWAMYGPNRYLHRVMGVFFSMDKMVGKGFETGLASLKAVAEK
jgi:uncharacterized protein YndB with AHSA1/START domain